MHKVVYNIHKLEWSFTVAVYSRYGWWT